MTRSFPDPDAAPLVALLAAGRSARFGGGKLDAQCAGKRLGQWVLDAVAEAGLAPGVIVTAPDTPVFAGEAGGWSLISNPRAETGLASSLACAAREAEARSAPVLLVLLADMPLIPAGLLRALATMAPAPAAARYPHGRPGAPALIPARLYPALMALTGDSGAAAVLAAEPDLALIDAQLEWLLDIDTAEDLAQAEAILRGS
jgi:CTP:molybdopterin cytidylyltransferase MocA